mmetsp:Transcript_123526/g.308675  ORF Transcript_123526/g.308675 Transcript_123526/m.308675 type:complete len:246 (-) Transcript_123526:1877-2614(-)
MAALAAIISSTSSVDAPAAIIASAASIRFCFSSATLAFCVFDSAFGRRQGARGLKRAKMDFLPLDVAVVVVLVGDNDFSAPSVCTAEASAAAAAAAPELVVSSTALAAFCSRLRSIMGPCKRMPNLSNASARCLRMALDTDMSFKILCTTLSSVNSMSNFVMPHAASWKRGMQSLKASAMSSSPPWAHWFSSAPPLLPPAPGGADEELEAPPREPPSSKPDGASSTTRFSRRSFLRPTSGITCTR